MLYLFSTTLVDAFFFWFVVLFNLDVFQTFNYIFFFMAGYKIKNHIITNIFFALQNFSPPRKKPIVPLFPDHKSETTKFFPPHLLDAAPSPVRLFKKPPADKITGSDSNCDRSLNQTTDTMAKLRCGAALSYCFVLFYFRQRGRRIPQVSSLPKRATLQRW